MNNFETNIKFVKGVGEKRAQFFNKLGIFDIRTLLSFYPRDYEDWSKTVTVANAPVDQVCCVKATMCSMVKESKIRKGMTLYKCDFTDGKDIIHVTLFNNKYLADSLKVYNDYLLFGKIEKTFTYATMSSPKIEKAENGEIIRPIYHSTYSLSSKTISTIVMNAIRSVGSFNETLSDEIINKYNLVSLDFAVKNIHFPVDNVSLEKAKFRLIFEELLVLQLGLLKLKHREKSSTNLQITKSHTDDFVRLLPFALTNAQLRVINECINDMSKEHPMNRLVQGDVGCGKTAVAAAVIYSAVKNGFQCALMAPTEILAIQHYQTLTNILKESGVKVATLTGSTTAKMKKEIKSQLIEGEIDLVVGTHALIQNDVEFKNLGLVVTDEQHRFGVTQRANLAQKGDNVHMLVMSATPIPRTLGLIIYGDLDISIIDELPKGRQVIDTFCVNSSYHKRIYNFIKKAVDNGNQAYVVCPLVEEGETDLKAANEYAQKLADEDLCGYKVGLLHGKMKSKEKDAVMADFAENKIQVLVSTTVVEVGVDVPNATVMLIENAERFGLSQLHQLRGRVGRGKDKSTCILVTDSKSKQTLHRMKTMQSTNDGFIIADEDLKMRGPGDFFGSRQHGLPQLKIADMLNDMQTLKLAQNCAKEILLKDYDLNLSQNKELSKSISKLFENSIA